MSSGRAGAGPSIRWGGVGGRGGAGRGGAGGVRSAGGRAPRDRACARRGCARWRSAARPWQTVVESGPRSRARTSGLRLGSDAAGSGGALTRCEGGRDDGREKRSPSESLSAVAFAAGSPARLMHCASATATPARDAGAASNTRLRLRRRSLLPPPLFPPPPPPPPPPPALPPLRPRQCETACARKRTPLSARVCVRGAAGAGSAGGQRTVRTAGAQRVRASPGRTRSSRTS